MVKSRLAIDRLKSIIYEKRMTQAALAKMLGLTAATVSSYFVGRSNPPIEVIEKMASVLGVPIEDIMAGGGQDIEQLKLLVTNMTAFAYHLSKGIVSLDIPPETKIEVLEYIQNTLDSFCEKQENAVNAEGILPHTWAGGGVCAARKARR